MIVIFSGEICTGKSVVAEALRRDHDFEKISTGDYLKEVAKTLSLKTERNDLQYLGDKLDYETSSKWIVSLFEKAIKPEIINYYFDSIRKCVQLELLKSQFPLSKHVHLIAPPEILEERYNIRAADDERDKFIPYEKAKSSPTEQQVRLLADFADEVFDTSKLSTGQVVSAILEKR